MTGDDYIEAMESVSLACRLLLNLDTKLDDCLRTVARGEALGPILDPTAFVTGGMQNLDHARRILEPAIRLRDAAHGIDPRHVAERTRP